MHAPTPRRRREPSPARLRAVGLLALGLALLVGMLALLEPDPFGSDSTVYADFADAATVGVVGNDVRMNGAIVGEITATERAADHARLRLEITPEAARALRGDARAALRPRTVLEGNAFVELQPGSAGTEPLGDRLIPLGRTTTYVPADQALRFAQPPVRNALKADLDGLAGAFEDAGARSTNRLIGRLPRMLGGFEQAGAAVTGSDGDELAGAIAGAQRTFAAVAETERSLGPMLRGTGRTATALATDGGVPLSASLERLPGVLARLRTGGAALESIVDELEPLGDDLVPALRELRPTLVDTQPVLDTARRTLVLARPFVTDLRAALAAGARAARPARRLLGVADPSLRILDGRLIPALNRTVDTGAPAYQALINAASGGAGAFRSIQTPDMPAGPGHIGDGHFVRFFVRFYSGFGVPDLSCGLLSLASRRLAAAFREAGSCAR